MPIIRALGEEQQNFCKIETSLDYTHRVNIKPLKSVVEIVSPPRHWLTDVPDVLPVNAISVHGDMLTTR